MSSRDARWLAAHACRGQVERSAIRAGCTEAEAEDVASEAVVRAALKDDLDVDRVHSWLQVVGRNLAIDALRARPTHTLLSRAYHHQPDALHATDDVDDAAEAQWLARRVSALAPRQRVVMEQRARGMSAGETAGYLQLPYKTVESLTSRARAQLRSALATTLTLVTASAVLCRRLLKPWPATAAAATAATAFALFTAGPAPAAMPELPDAVMTARTAVRPDVPRTPSVGTGAQAAPRPDASSRRPAGSRGAPAAPVQVVPALSAGGVAYSGVEHTRSSENQSLSESLVQCVQDGIDISTTHLGCRDGSPAR